MGANQGTTATAVLIGLLLLAPAVAMGGKIVDLDLALCAPDQNIFTVDVDNAFFPLPEGQQWIYRGKEGSRTIGLRITRHLRDGAAL